MIFQGEKTYLEQFYVWEIGNKNCLQCLTLRNWQAENIFGKVLIFNHSIFFFNVSILGKASLNPNISWEQHPFFTYSFLLSTKFRAGGCSALFFWGALGNEKSSSPLGRWNPWLLSMPIVHVLESSPALKASTFLLSPAFYYIKLQAFRNKRILFSFCVQYEKAYRITIAFLSLFIFHVFPCKYFQCPRDTRIYQVF